MQGSPSPRGPLDRLGSTNHINSNNDDNNDDNNNNTMGD